MLKDKLTVAALFAAAAHLSDNRTSKQTREMRQARAAEERDNEVRGVKQLRWIGRDDLADWNVEVERKKKEKKK